MYKLFRDSVRAAYTPEELSAMLHEANVSGARRFLHGSTHLGIERRARAVGGGVVNVAWTGIISRVAPYSGGARA